MTLTLATLVLLALLLPGAFAAWGFQRHREWYGHRARDWFVRLAGFSALLLAIGSWPLYWLLSNHYQGLAGLRPVSRWLAVAPLVYLMVPIAIGSAMGWLSQREAFARHLSPRRHPSAWDHVFGVFLDQDTGAPLRDSGGSLIATGAGVLVGQSNVAYIEFTPS